MASKLMRAMLPGLDDPDLDFRVMKQAPFIAVFTVVLLIAFLLLIPVSLISSHWNVGLYPVSVLFLTLLSAYAMALLRRAEYNRASTLMTAVIFLSCVAALFLMSYNGVASQTYRPFAFMAVMTACNSLVSLDRRQIVFFFLGIIACWLAAFATIFRHLFAESGSETLAIMLVATLGLTLASLVALFNRRLSDELLANAEAEAARAKKALTGLTESLEAARQGMEIGDQIISAAERVEKSAGSIRTLQGYLAEESSGLVKESEGFGQSSRMVLDSANAMKRATDEQHASITETSAAITEISANLTSINHIASQRRATLDDVYANGESQRTQLKKLLDAVSTVQDSSEAIGSFVTTVQDIASRTSLLSMNASIQAARAGASGKGFAVVAQEIRGLSEETQRNADTIKSLLERNGQSVRGTVEMTRAFSAFIERNDDELKRLIGSIDEILRGITEMDTGTREVVTALQDMVGSAEDSARRVGEVVGQVEKQKQGYAHISQFAAELHGRIEELKSAVAEIGSTANRVAEAGRLNIEQVSRRALFSHK
jgi:methyl-accepting chemotaxis protein